MVTSEISSSTFNGINSRFFLLPKGVQRQQTRNSTSGAEMQVLNVYLTSEAVHLLQKGEESILERLKPDIDTDREALRQFNEHSRLVKELSEVRNLLKI